MVSPAGLHYLKQWNIIEGPRDVLEKIVEVENNVKFNMGGD